MGLPLVVSLHEVWFYHPRREKGYEMVDGCCDTMLAPLVVALVQLEVLHF